MVYLFDKMYILLCGLSDEAQLENSELVLATINVSNKGQAHTIIPFSICSKWRHPQKIEDESRSFF
jgi:hypothetical protein